MSRVAEVGALASGYLLAGVPNCPSGDNGGSSVRIGRCPTFEPQRVHRSPSISAVKNTSFSSYGTSGRTISYKPLGTPPAGWHRSASRSTGTSPCGGVSMPPFRIGTWFGAGAQRHTRSAPVHFCCRIGGCKAQKHKNADTSRFGHGQNSRHDRICRPCGIPCKTFSSPVGGPVW